MTPTNKQLLDALEKNIQRLSDTAKQYNHIKLDKPCFDSSLFKDAPSRTGYDYYLNEINNNFQKLSVLINKDHHDDHLTQISYLAELIINQIEALQKEILTVNVKHKSNFMEKEPDTVYEKYNQYLGYLRRLEFMKYELEQSSNSKSIDTQQLAVINQRIANCKKAISELELKIESI